MAKIEWTERTWNPISGCSRVSAGCQNCYSETMTKRLAAMGNEKYQGLLNERSRFNGVIKFDEKALLKPLSVKKPMTYFVNSMSDLFHENVKNEWIDQIFAVMALCPQHTFQILTKRADRMRQYVPTLFNYQGYLDGYWLGDAIESMFGKSLPQMHDTRLDKPLQNVWLGVSVENQKSADERIPELLQTPAAVRFLSCEPLLEKLDLTSLRVAFPVVLNALNGKYYSLNSMDAIEDSDKTEQIDWVIVGGESGSGARPCSVDWIHSIVRQCRAAKTACFVKQLGTNATASYYDFYAREYVENKGLDWESADWDIRDGQPPMDAQAKFPTKNKGGDIAEFPKDLQVREMPQL